MQVFSPLLPVNCWKKSLSTRIISDLKQKWQITSQYHSLLCAVFPQNQGAFIHCRRCVLWYSVLFYSASPLALKLNAVFVWIQNDLRSSRKVRKWQCPNMKVWLILGWAPCTLTPVLAKNNESLKVALLSTLLWKVLSFFRWRSFYWWVLQKECGRCGRVYAWNSVVWCER